jgi:tRNA (cytidine/uridine-2'-O-)-methyltransferase
VFHVVLYRPEIAPNTGNIIRLAANTGAALHLIEPLGFALDDARLRRAGLDYREYAPVRCHASLEAALAALGHPRVIAYTTGAARRHTEVRHAPGDALLFGPESAGLPRTILDALGAQACVRLPMRPRSRSLNLSNAVAVALYEAWRQLGFEGAV